MAESRRIVFPEFGKASEQVQINTYETPKSAPGEVLVRLLYAPINPADFNYIEGTYGLKPTIFPAPAGMEGSGVVLELGDGVKGIAVGDHVALLAGPGCWQQVQSVPTADLFVLPEGLDPIQGAMLKVNPPTAWAMLHELGPPEPGSLVVQNLGNSNVGLSTIGIGKHLGIDVVSFVRSESGRDQCKAAGASEDQVFLDTVDGLAKAKDVLGKRCGVLGFNGVGGDSALRVMNLLGEGATLLSYGAMGRKPIKVPTGMLLFKDLRLQGFWLTRWLKNHSSDELTELLGKVAAVMADGHLSLPVAKTYRFTDVSAALDHASQGGLGGKVVLEFGEVEG